MQEWRPCASNEALRARASVFADIRAFFAARRVLEVDTPHLSAAGNSDPSITSFQLSAGERHYYLATSPEFAMKRLLAAGIGDIYQLAHVFRDGEDGRHHNPEFMLLEWYRTDFDLARIMDETIELVCSVGDGRFRDFAVEHVEYQALFRRVLSIDPHEASLAELQECAGQQDMPVPILGDERDLWLDWLMSAFVQPRMKAQALTLVSGYPTSQAALAQLDDDGRTAQRFELFCGPVELANGYRELADSAEQRTRFLSDLEIRRARSLHEPELDERLLAALPRLPACCGVALGVDRLLMLLLDSPRLQSVMSFPVSRA